MMKFVLKNVRNSSRLGSITEAGGKTDLDIETPMCMLYTRTGSVPNLGNDMLKRLEDVPNIVHYPLPLLAEHHEIIAAYGKGIKKFTTFEDTSLAYCSLQDSAALAQTGYNDKYGAAVWGRGGKMKLDVSLFMRTQEALVPDFYQALCDSDVQKESRRKRIRKSVDRSLDFLDKCLESHMASERLKNTAVFGVIEGGYSLDERIRSAKETVKRPVAGYVIEGFHNFGPATENFSLLDIFELLQKTLSELPEEKPRLMHGVWTPHSVLDAVQLGVDIFDSSYPYLVTERGGALVFNFKLPNIDPKTKPDSNGGSGRSTPAYSTNGGSGKNRCYELDLNDKQYADDFDPILKGCTCFTCKNHSRSYIHHLLNTSELLSGVLLMIHNLHHYFGFFKAIRESIKKDRFYHLQDLIENQRNPSR